MFTTSIEPQGKILCSYLNIILCRGEILSPYCVPVFVDITGDQSKTSMMLCSQLLICQYGSVLFTIYV